MWSTGKGARGFTLIEILVVLVLLGLVATITLPALNRGLDSSRFREQVRQFTERLNGSRVEALRQNQTEQLLLLPGDQQPGLRPLAELENISVTASRGAALPRPLMATFYPDGSAQALDLWLGRDKQLARLTVDPLTGRIAVRLNPEE